MTKPDLEKYLFNKVAPNAPELEEAVLGAMLLDKRSVPVINNILKPECFYRDKHALIFKAIVGVQSTGDPVDILTVTHYLKNKKKLDEVGGPAYITELTGRVGSAAHIEAHARVIQQKYLLRELIRISSDTIGKCYEEADDSLDLFDQLQKELNQLGEFLFKKTSKTLGQLLEQAGARIKERYKNKDEISGIPSGYIDLDQMTLGWQNSDLIILAARPGMGKSALMMAFARNASIEFGKVLAIFSMEMSGEQLANRLISTETEIDNRNLRSGRLSEDDMGRINDKLLKIYNIPILIDDTPALTIFELQNKARQLKSEYEIEMILIDYMQLMSGMDKRGANREQEISQISRGIKAIAKELDIPIIALSQLNRAVETRGGAKRPALSDLRESGAIEADADIVIFLYRPEYYGITEDESGNDLKQYSELIIAKHRNGALGTVSLRFIDRFTKFEDWKRDEVSPPDTSKEVQYKESSPF